MQADEFVKAVRARLLETGQTKHSAAVSHGLPRDAIASVLAGHMPKLDRAEAICEALGLEFYVGLKRSPLVSVDVHAFALALRDMEVTLALMDNDPSSDASVVRNFVAAYDLYVELIDRVAAPGRTREEAAKLLRQRGRPSPPDEFLEVARLKRWSPAPDDLAAAQEAFEIVHKALRRPSEEPGAEETPPKADPAEKP